MATTQHRCSSSAHTCLTRRAVLAAGGATAGALTLAACGPDDGGAPPATDNGTSGGTDGTDGGAGGGAIASLDDVPVGGAIAATTAAGEAILLTRPTENEIRAFSSVCTHQGCAVEPGSGELECPCHGSRFDLSTGEVLSGPAFEPLPEVSVEVSADGEITG